MAKTAAERQKAYRAQRQFAGEDGNGERRISAYVSTRAALALDRLANSYGVTKREMLERLVIAEEEKLLKTIKLDSPDGEAYLSGSPLRSNLGAK
jgi:hypothetical protein